MPLKHKKHEVETTTVYDIVGHSCQLPISDGVIINTIYSGCCVRLRRWWYTLITVDPLLAQTSAYHILRSSIEVLHEQRRHMRDHHSVIHPYSRAIALWETIMIPVYVVAFVLVPFFLHDHFYEPVFVVMKLMVDLIFTIDMFVHFSTGYVDNGVTFVLHKKAIARHYFRGHFATDFLSSLPLHLLSAAMGFPKKLAVAMLVLKLARYPTFIRGIKSICDMYNTSIIVYEVIKFVVICVTFNNWTSFITTSLGMVAQKNDKMFEMYRFTKMMILAGQTYAESKENRTLLTTVLILIISSVLHMYMLASMAKALLNYSKQRNQFETLVRQMDEFMRYQGLPVRLRNRAYEYIEFKFKKNIFHEELILGSLSTKLREEIMQCSCQKLIEHVDFFRGLPIDAIYRLTTKMRPIVCMTNDVIVQSGTVGNAMYFLFSGVVAVFTKNGKEVCHLYDGSHFGEISLLLNDVRVASVIAIRNCELYRLNRKDFQEAIEPFPNLLAKIRRTAMKRLEKTMEMSDSEEEEIRTENYDDEASASNK